MANGGVRVFVCRAGEKAALDQQVEEAKAFARGLGYDKELSKVERAQKGTAMLYFSKEGAWSQFETEGYFANSRLLTTVLVMGKT